MANKPGIPKGTRDFGPLEMARREYILGHIRRAFERYGFQPIQTPSFENLDTLTGKYGEEGDRLIFKILNSGDYLGKVDPDTRASDDHRRWTPKIAEKALKYDLTVPFARYVVMHRNELELPFKRYQIQPVWRADRPQKGRFREFYQCDADVVGSASLWQEMEFIQLYDSVFQALGLQGTTIKVNHRKILGGIAESLGVGHLLVEFTVALDKLDKIGIEGVETEMREKGIGDDSLARLRPLFSLAGSPEERIQALGVILAESEEATQGLEELSFLFRETAALGLKSCTLEFDLTLARGLDYYTGAIFEVKAPDEVAMGSIGGGGRYDDLTGVFGMPGLSGVGISFGLDRIYLVLEGLGKFPDILDRSLDVLCLNFGGGTESACFRWVQTLRERGLRADLYPDPAKLAKQFKYADRRAYPSS